MIGPQTPEACFILTYKMNISYKWLKRYIDTDLSPRELAAVLTSVGLECDNVEEVETIRGGLRGLKIGKVLTCVDHPDSDHLHVTTVDVADPAGPLQIVCGAPNVATGQTVVVATIGTVLYDGDKEFTIKKSKMRGVESFGMICAEDEIGLGESHDGIMVLPDGVEPGTPAAEYFKVESDFCLEVELTPNRVDAASHFGVARDLKAYNQCRDFEEGRPLSSELRLPSVADFKADCEDGAVTIEVLDPQGCPRYSGVTIRDVKVGPSPEWLQNLLVTVGLRPINNIVDITNFILMGLGQPLHCFDLAKVKGEKIVVRTCEEGQPFTTLDEVERKLSAADLMICNAEDPMCIAGVFGGLESGVTEKTTDVFIESAWFNPTRIRRTARRHGLSTDASFRYERGTDPDITVYAAQLAALMIKELAGGRICGAVTDVCPSVPKRAELDFSLAYCNTLIGKVLPKDLIVCILRALEFEVTETADPEVLHLTVPTYRVDVTRPCDVVEEILRIYGYNNVEFDNEMHITLSNRTAVDDSHDLKEALSNQLTAQGFTEILNNSLTAVGYYRENEAFPLENCVKVMNPLSQDLGVMRQTLLYGGLETIAHNVNRKASDLRLYEFGHVYTLDPSKTPSKEAPLAPFKEREMLGLWLTGNFTASSWNTTQAEATFFDLRAVVSQLFRRAGISDNALNITQISEAPFSAALKIDAKTGVHLATIGLIDRKTLKAFDIEQPVVYASIEWEAFFKMAMRTKVTFEPLPKTQPVKRDLALLLDNGVTFAEVQQTVRKAGGKLLGEISLFDVYEGKNLPAGKKSYAVSIILQDPEKTLNDKQIDATMKKIVDALKKNFGAELR